MTLVHVPGLPFALEQSEEWPWATTESGVRVQAKPQSDLFIDPSGGDDVAAESLLNAVTALGLPPEGDFTFSAKVGVEFADTFDAGVLLVWSDEHHWAKLCFERSPAGESMVVSVVTRELSDDANGFVVDGTHVWLRLARVGNVLGFHASTDGRHWAFVRAFSLGRDDLRVGFEAQSPMGEGCAVEFTDVTFAQRRLSDLRDGS